MKLLLILFYFLSTGTISAQDIKEDSVTLEGYYMHGWESSAFYLLDQGKVYKPYWLSLHPDFPINDSLWQLIGLYPNFDGRYLRVEGILKSGGGFGHMGGAEKEIVVTKILYFDPKNTMSDFLKRNTHQSNNDSGVIRIEPPGNKVETYYEQNKGNDQPSIISGSVDNGYLQNAKLLPFSGTNFHYFDTASYLNGRAFTSDKVLNTMLNTYEIFETQVPGRSFCVMECSHRHGGKLPPHRTHQNGLSVDFMMPLLQNKMPYYGFDSIGQTHYLLDFNDQGQYKADTSISIDFELVARHILLLNEEAKKQGLKVSKVIIKIELKDELFAGEYGKKLKASGIYIVQNLTPLVNSVHDDHYHIDFELLR